VGIVWTPDGRAFAIAIYVTGQGSKGNREARIAQLARAIYDGYASGDALRQRSAMR
jgi:beta-lactamase class A